VVTAGSVDPNPVTTWAYKHKASVVFFPSTIYGDLQVLTLTKDQLPPIGSMGTRTLTDIIKQALESFRR